VELYRHSLICLHSIVLNLLIKYMDNFTFFRYQVAEVNCLFTVCCIGCTIPGTAVLASERVTVGKYHAQYAIITVCYRVQFILKSNFLGYNAMYSGESQPTYRRNIHAPSTGR
jgi:ABC-type glycerol-3-phosphate transport system permease component